jgi:hypothetical protein
MSMIPKSGNRFSDKILLKRIIQSMIPKSGNRFSDKIMLERRIYTVIRFNWIKV